MSDPTDEGAWGYKEDDLAGSPNIDEGADYSEPLGGKLCAECQEPTIGEHCGFCGADLCPACFEMGGGFCSKSHSQEEIDAYEDEIMGPPTPERLAQRQARKELKELGIL